MATGKGLPLFYKNPKVLRHEDHKDMGLVPTNNFSFSAGATAIPLSISELMPAVRNYPIVFIKADGPTPVAIVGLKEGQNLMLEKDGKWAEGAYVPAYIRRYPFILVQSPNEDKRFLAYDGESDRVQPVSKAPGAVPIFNVDGSPSAAVQPMLQLCEAYHQHKEKEADFLNAIAKADLLVDRHVDIEFPNKTRYRLDGFSVIDVERYRALPAKTLKDWTQKGWSDAIALHFASAQNWDLLLERNHAVNV